MGKIRAIQGPLPRSLPITSSLPSHRPAYPACTSPCPLKGKFEAIDGRGVQKQMLEPRSLTVRRFLQEVVAQVTSGIPTHCLECAWASAMVAPYKFQRPPLPCRSLAPYPSHCYPYKPFQFPISPSLPAALEQRTQHPVLASHSLLSNPSKLGFQFLPPQSPHS